MRSVFSKSLRDRTVNTIQGLINYDSFTCLPNKWKLCRIRHGFREYGVNTEPLDLFVEKVHRFFRQRSRHGQKELFHSIFGFPLTNDLLECLSMGYADTVVEGVLKESISKGILRFLRDEFTDVADQLSERSIHGALTRLYDLKYYDRVLYFEIDSFLHHLELVLTKESDVDHAKRVLMPIRVVLGGQVEVENTQIEVPSNNGISLIDLEENVDPEELSSFHEATADVDSLTQSELNWLLELASPDLEFSKLLPRIKGIGPSSDLEHSVAIRPLLCLTRKFNSLMLRKSLKLNPVRKAIYETIRREAESLLKKYGHTFTSPTEWRRFR